MDSSSTTSSNRSSRKVLTAKPQTVRRVNRAAVLELLRQHRCLSRADLARLTGIHRSNISIIIEDLQAHGVLREELRRNSARGRTPSLISFNNTSFGVIGVSLRQSRTTVAFASLDGHVERTETFTTPATPAEFLVALDEACHSVRMEGSGKMERGVRQIVISIPGIITQKKGAAASLWLPGLPQYCGVNLVDLAAQKTGIPCAAANNAGLGAIAALHSNQKEGGWISDFVFLVVEDIGVGSGLIIDHKLYSGHDGSYAGELGHTVIDPAGPRCNCGRQGCLEMFINDSATWKRYEPELEFTPERFLSLLDAVAAGEPRALAAVRETCYYLSLGVSNIALTLNPSRIIFAGALTRIWPIVERELRSAFFLPEHHAMVQPAVDSLDVLFLKGAIESGLDIVLAQTAERRGKRAKSA